MKRSRRRLRSICCLAVSFIVLLSADDPCLHTPFDSQFDLGIRHLYASPPSTGLVNKHSVGSIGNGVVVYLPSFFEELDGLQSQGVDFSDRLFISEGARFVFAFRQIVDGLREVELGRSR